jgi:hypothetical protein
MELVPIIYTVLQIVAVLALVVIGLSFIIYKIKLKNNTTDKPASAFAQPAIKAEQTVRKVVQRITKPIQYPQQPIPKKAEQPKTKKAPEKVRTTPKRNDPPKSKTKKHDTRIDRIEIVKSLSPQIRGKEKPEFKHEPSKKKKLTSSKNISSLGDEILDKYAEDENNEMFTLDTKNKKLDKLN